MGFLSSRIRPGCSQRQRECEMPWGSKPVFLLAAFCCLVGSLARAQEVRATIGGRILDSQGAVVPGAAVTVVSDDTGVEQTTRSNDVGAWIVQFLLPGRYHFLVAAAGFMTAERSGFTLQAADNKQIDVQLEVGSPTQSVNVT